MQNTLKTEGLLIGPKIICHYLVRLTSYKNRFFNRVFLTTYYPDNRWPILFGLISNPLVFYVLYLVKYSGDFTYFNSHTIKKWLKNTATLNMASHLHQKCCGLLFHSISDQGEGFHPSDRTLSDVPPASIRPRVLLYIVSQQHFTLIVRTIDYLQHDAMHSQHMCSHHKQNHNTAMDTCGLIIISRQVLLTRLVPRSEIHQRRYISSVVSCKYPDQSLLSSYAAIP